MLVEATVLSQINEALASQEVDSAHITGHSFRIGAATTAARMGLEDSLIQTLGRWQSSAFLRYFRTSGQVLALTSAHLLGPYSLSGQHYHDSMRFIIILSLVCCCSLYHRFNLLCRHFFVTVVVLLFYVLFPTMRRKKLFIRTLIAAC